MTNLLKVAKPTGRVERHWIADRKRDLEVYRIPIGLLYFNIENGRYADRLIRLHKENPGVLIDPREDRWKDEIERMLAGEHRDTSRDKAAFDKLIEDIEAREQLRPGVVLRDGGVLDGNRRLAALRRLWRSSKNAAKFSMFEGVILPEETTEEDRWRIEAGLQLGMNERWDYSPINELLKVRQGLQMYEQMIEAGGLPAGTSPVTLVARAIYGKTEDSIGEMADRLRLIDEYLTFIGYPGDYDRIGQASEDFLEAARIVRAAQNHQLPLKFVAKLKAVLFYVIDRDLMDNWELRHIYHALGGDPRKRGRKPKSANMVALQQFLDHYPDPRVIHEDLQSRYTAPPPATGPNGRKKSGPSPSPKAKPTSAAPTKKNVDEIKVETATEVFKRKMELTEKKHSVRRMAESAQASLVALEGALADPATRKGLSVDDRSVVLESLDAVGQSLTVCRKHLKT